MQVTINHNELLDKLSVVEKALPGKISFPLVEGIYMAKEGNTLTFCANSLEMAIRASLSVINSNGEGAIVLPKQFVQIAKQLPGGEVMLTVKGDRIEILCGKSKFNLNCMNAEEFPIIDENYAGEPSLEIEGQALKEMITKTTFCASNDISKHVFQGVQISNNHGVLTCVASDTYRLSVYEKIRIDHDGPFKILVPGKLITEVGRIVNDNDNVKIYISGNELVFAVNDYVISVRLLDGEYPNFANAFPTKAETEIVINKQELANTISRARLLTEKRTEMICISIDDVFTIESKNETGQMNETLPIQTEGEPLPQFLINAKYLFEGVKAFDSDDLNIYFHGEFGPVVIKEEGFKYLALPIKKT